MSVQGIDNAVDEYVKGGMDGAFPTGWIMVASVSSPQHDVGMSDGYITVTSDGLPHHVQLGLLQVAQQDKQSISMMSSMASLLSGGDDEDDD